MTSFRDIKLWIVAIVGVLAPLHAAMATVFTLVLVDLLTGTLAALKHDLPLTSNKLKKTVIKVCVYELAIVLAYLVGHNLTGPSVPVLQMVASLIGLTELQSILENLRVISGNSVFDTILKRVSTHTDNRGNKAGGPDESK